jgi:hypothetical protein
VNSLLELNLVTLFSLVSPYYLFKNMKMRPASIEEYSKPDDLPEGKKLRFHDHKPVVVDMGPEYQARLKELQEKSRKINQLVHQKLEEQNLPYSAKKDVKKILRLTFELRPPFVSSDEEKEGTRMSAAIDEIIFYLHLSEGNTFDALRLNTWGMKHTLELADAIDNSYSHEEDTPELLELDEVLESMDEKKIADLLVKRIAACPFTKKINHPYECKTTEDATKFFQDERLFLFQHSGFTLNLIKETLRTVLTNEIQTLYQSEPRPSVKQVKNSIQEKMDELLQLNICHDNKENNIVAKLRIKFNIEDIERDRVRDGCKPTKNFDSKNTTNALIQSIIKDVTDEYKRMLFSKKS